MSKAKTKPTEFQILLKEVFDYYRREPVYIKPGKAKTSITLPKISDYQKSISKGFRG